MLESFEHWLSIALLQKRSMQKRSLSVSRCSSCHTALLRNLGTTNCLTPYASYMSRQQSSLLLKFIRPWACASLAVSPQHDVSLMCRVHLIGGSQATGLLNDTVVVYTPATLWGKTIWLHNYTLPLGFFSHPLGNSGMGNDWRCYCL